MDESKWLPLGRNPPLYVMRHTTRTVVGGNVVVEQPVVAVPRADVNRPFAMSARDEEELIAAMGKIDRGEFVSAEDLLESLHKYG